MKSTSYITLDLQKPNYVTVYGVQDDQRTRWVHADLVDGGNAWTPPTGTLCTIRYRKPDGTGGFYDALENGQSAYTISGSSIDFGLAAQSMSVPGTVSVMLSFYTSSGERLSTFLFLLQVEKNPISDAEIISNDYFNVLTQTLSQNAQYANAAETSAKAAASSAADAAAATNLKFYSTVTQLGLTYGETTIADTYAAMANGSVGVFVSNSFSDTDLPTAGTVIMAKATWGTRGYIILYGMQETGAVHVKTIVSDGSTGTPSSTWQKLLAGDSGWQTADLTSSFQAYNSYAPFTPKYRKVGNTVFVEGIVAPTSALTGSNTEVTIFTLPEGYRPPMNRAIVCQGSGMNRWTLSISTGGVVGFSRYGTTSLADAEAGVWLPFTTSFCV